MKEDKLEKNILDSIYKLERKKTIAWVIKYSVIVTFLLLALFSFIDILFQIFKEQETLDVLSLFEQDIEIIRMYFFEIISTVFEETPADLFIAIIVVFTLIITAGFVVIKNFRKTLNKIKSMVNYYKKS